MHSASVSCERAMEKGPPSKLEVEYFSSENYVGLFPEERAANFLRNLADIFAEEVKKSTGVLSLTSL